MERMKTHQAVKDAAKPTMSKLSCYYTEKELTKYTKQLADLGITKDEEVTAVLEFIHKLASIAVDIVLEKNKSILVE